MGIETLPTPERLKEDVQLIKNWLSKQPHLPKIKDDEWLSTILHYNKYSIEKSKLKIDNYFSFRTKYPEILRNRDPIGSEILQAKDACKMAWADRLTKDGELILFGQMQSDTSIFEMKSVMKFFFMLHDLSALDNDGHIYTIAFVDCRYLSYTHFLKALPWFKVGVEVFFSGYSERVKAIHVINAPGHFDKVINTIKGFLPKKISERFYVHSAMEDVCKVVDEDVVCRDFGGKGPSFAEYDEHTWKKVENLREWFLEQDDVCTNEKLRTKTENEAQDLNGSFRKIEID